MGLCSALLLFAVCANTSLAQPRDFSNGCGSGWSVHVVPNSPLGHDFKAACDAHDNCYSRCEEGGLNVGTEKCDQNPALKEARRTVCDRDFRAEMARICRDYPTEAICLTLAKIYYIAVSLGGGGAFNGREIQDLIVRARLEPGLDTTSLDKQLDAAIAGRLDLARNQIHIRSGNGAVVQSWSTARKSAFELQRERQTFDKSTIIDRNSILKKGALEREVERR